MRIQNGKEIELNHFVCCCWYYSCWHFYPIAKFWSTHTHTHILSQYVSSLLFFFLAHVFQIFDGTKLTGRHYKNWKEREKERKDKKKLKTKESSMTWSSLVITVVVNYRSINVHITHTHKLYEWLVWFGWLVWLQVKGAANCGSQSSLWRRPLWIFHSMGSTIDLCICVCMCVCMYIYIFDSLKSEGKKNYFSGSSGRIIHDVSSVGPVNNHAHTHTHKHRHRHHHHQR